MSSSPPDLRTLGALRAAGYVSRSVRQEIRKNLLTHLKSEKPLFPGLLGYDESVVPAVENALLCGHDLIFLGERGQGKSRMIRSLVDLLDEWMPVVVGSDIPDDPMNPVSAHGRSVAAEMGEEMEISWLHRDLRYGEKLATPDVSIADLIGDVDPIKVAEGRYLGDEHTIHFGMLPRSHRGIFCINELPDLTEKVQVGMFNIMEERDVQIKGYNIRLPIDVLVVASANPEDYTSRGRIITPLKDRYAAQIRTHYPKTRELEMNVVEQEADIPELDGIQLFMPEYMKEIVGEITFEARSSPDVSQASGVSVRMSISNYETLAANALRRAIRQGELEAVPRISDLSSLLASTSGKIELEYAGAETGEKELVDGLVRRACRRVFDARCAIEDFEGVVEAFDKGWQVEVSSDLAATDYLDGLNEIPGLRETALSLAGEDTAPRLASAIEFILEGLHLLNKLNKHAGSSNARYQKA
ncbi:MAG: magnesium chelatase [Deltaproteobacteria bacterium]|nr:magnesium chelatase [Deltaproteobacteria bacterium]